MTRHLALFGMLAIAACRDDAVVGTDVLGPPCDCDSYFPMCVGASWRYVIKSEQTGTFTQKTFSITDWGDPNREDLGLTELLAFRQRRVAATDTKDSWLQKSTDQHRVLWLMDEWFDLHGNRTKTQLYEPWKLRVDETPEHATPGATWRERYIEHEIVSDERLIEHDIEWETLDPQDHTGFGATFCQHKRDVSTDTTVPVDATYCFVRGVGKVWELTELVDEEQLVDWTIPGCTR